eukprot:CCRYP_020652-RB/>CCRYP_020652-RB protein AED:0.16 eAED:0.16 QI:30/1/1/1/1/0.66/3/1861/1013
MTTAKPRSNLASSASSFPIKRIAFPRHRSGIERTIQPLEGSSNSEAQRILEVKKAEAKLAVREAARLAAQCQNVNPLCLCGEDPPLKKKGAKRRQLHKQRSFWRKKSLRSKSKRYRHVDPIHVLRPSPPASHQAVEDDPSLGWTQTSATEPLTAFIEEGTDANSVPTFFRSSPKNFLKKAKINERTTQIDTGSHPQYKDMCQLAQNLSASGAYACSVCGAIYDSLANATRHEDRCLVRFVETVEQNKDDTTMTRFLTFPAEHFPTPFLRPTLRQVSMRGLPQTGVRGLPVKGRCQRLDAFDCQYENSSYYNNNSSHNSNQANATTAKSRISAVTFLEESPNNGRNFCDASSNPSPLCQKPAAPPRSRIDFTPPHTGGEVNFTSPHLKKLMVISDEAAVDILIRSKQVLYALCLKELSSLNNRDVNGEDDTKRASLLLMKREFEAQRELALLSRDRHYYGMVEQRSLERRYGPFPRYDSPYKYYYNRQYARMGLGSAASKQDTNENEASLLPKKMWNVIKNRFEHAYELIKEGPASLADEMDHSKKTKDNKGNMNTGNIKHGRNTLFVNVVVKNSVQVVNNELERLARGWWQSETSGVKAHNAKEAKVLDFQFEWIRAQTQKRVIQLAAAALASDFTPRKVAVQLSNDLFRLMGPQLQQRGVTIQTDIEYRSGQYFVLAVNVLHIDWILLMDYTAKQLTRRRRRWIKEQGMKEHKSLSLVATSAPIKGASKKKRRTVRELLLAARMRFPSRNEVVAQFLAFMNRFHFVVSLPLLNILYYLFFKYAVDKFILANVTDDIFRYVEKMGMEMQLGIKSNSAQASFMLAALRELRDDDTKRKKKGEEEIEGEDYKPILGPLLGPLVKDDGADVKLPPNFEPPESLEFVAFEVDLPIGFLRLRWAMLHTESTFLKDAFFADIMKYENITGGKWSTNEKEIGLPKAPDGIDEAGFLNATLEFTYLMPKSAFVKANTCYATHEIIHYDSYCFVIKEKTLTPEVPVSITSALCRFCNCATRL